MLFAARCPSDHVASLAHRSSSLIRLAAHEATTVNKHLPRPVWSRASRSRPIYHSACGVLNTSVTIGSFSCQELDDDSTVSQRPHCCLVDGGPAIQSKHVCKRMHVRAHMHASMDTSEDFDSSNVTILIQRFLYLPVGSTAFISILGFPGMVNLRHLPPRTTTEKLVAISILGWQLWSLV